MKKEKSDKSTKRSKSKDGGSDKKSKTSSKSKDKKSDKDSKKAKEDKKKDRSKSKNRGDDDAKSNKSGKSDRSKTKSSTSKSKDKLKKPSKKELTEGEDPISAKLTDPAGQKDQMAASMMQGPFSRGASVPAGLAATTTCAIHGKDLNYYCENTESLICHDCTVMGPHNTQLHRIQKMSEAFGYRFQTLNKTITEDLVPKRTQLIGQIVRLDARLDQVKTVKQTIERDIRSEYAGIMERLKSAEGVKTAVLSHDLSEIQQDITRIDEILMFMEEITHKGTE